MATTTAQWLLRRLAARVLKVYERHAPTSAPIAAYQGSLIPAAQTYITAYDAATQYQPQWRREMEEGRGAMAELATTIDAWKPHIAREMPGVDTTTLGDKPTVPEDLVEDGVRLAEALAAVTGADGAAPAWAQSASVEMLAKADAAELQTDQAAAADAQLSELQKAVRTTGVALEGHLSFFRRTLRTVVGRSHPDYQKLRVERAGTPDEDDDPSGPQPSPPVTPAPNPPAA